MRNKNAKVSDPNSFVTCSGDRYHILYSPVVDSDGTISLVESGKDDIQDFIDSFRDQTDIHFIISRIQAGDTSVLREGAMYGDFTGAPKTYAEALQMVIDAENKFMALPLDVRNLFDNDYKKWFAQAGSDDWFSKMDSVIAKESVKEDVEVSSVES